MKIKPSSLAFVLMPLSSSHASYSLADTPFVTPLSRCNNTPDAIASSTTKQRMDKIKSLFSNPHHDDCIDPPKPSLKDGHISTEVKPSNKKYFFIESYFQQRPLLFNTLTRMVSMAASFPLFSIMAQSASKNLSHPKWQGINYQGAGPEMLVAGADIFLILLSYNFINKQITHINSQKLPLAISLITPAHLLNQIPDRKNPHAPTMTGLNNSKHWIQLLLKCFITVIPCSLATTIMSNGFAHNGFSVHGFGRTMCNNFLFLSALEIISEKHPGRSRARILTALSCAALTGANNGLALSRKIPAGHIHGYAAMGALATLVFQAIFEGVRYPIYSKAYRKEAQPDDTDSKIH